MLGTNPDSWELIWSARLRLRLRSAMNNPIKNNMAARPRIPPMALLAIVFIRWSVVFTESEVETEVGAEACTVGAVAAAVELEGNPVDSVASDMWSVDVWAQFLVYWLASCLAAVALNISWDWRNVFRCRHRYERVSSHLNIQVCECWYT